MYREKLEKLKQWKAGKFRKPLIIRGARQVGKTWLLKEFGRTEFAKVVYVNFEDAPVLKTLFESDFDIKRILTSLEIYSQTTINPEDTLIILDEIQSAERGITSLKYFNEKAPEYYIVAAGSLLGMGLHSNQSFPVGKVDFLDIRPMSFYEFLLTMNESKLVNALKNPNWEVISLFSDKLNEYLKYYLFVGGMPEVVDAFSQTRDWELVRKIQKRIIDSYEADFSKYAPKDTVPRIRMVWQSIPSQLAKENKKLVYGVIREGSRAKDFEMAIQWLLDCGLLLKSPRISKPGLPISAYYDISTFKLYLHDVGLLCAMSSIDVSTIIHGNEIFTDFKGALAEQYAMQQLRLDSDRQIAYWTNERSTSEVDFIVQYQGDLTPIEVKSGENTRSKSFRLFCEKYQPKRAFRFSLLNYKAETWMENIPLYAIESFFSAN